MSERHTDKGTTGERERGREEKRETGKEGVIE